MMDPLATFVVCALTLAVGAALLCVWLTVHALFGKGQK